MSDGRGRVGCLKRVQNYSGYNHVNAEPTKRKDVLAHSRILSALQRRLLIIVLGAMSAICLVFDNEAAANHRMVWMWGICMPDLHHGFPPHCETSFQSADGGVGAQVVVGRVGMQVQTVIISHPDFERFSSRFEQRGFECSEVACAVERDGIVTLFRSVELERVPLEPRAMDQPGLGLGLERPADFRGTVDR
jgi:hypothetical protein